MFTTKRHQASPSFRRPVEDNSISSKFTRLAHDAGWITLSSVVTAGVGLLFWGFAARSIPAERLGYQTAVLAAIVAPAAIIASGVGDALNAVAGANPQCRAALVRHAYLLGAGLAVPLALASAFTTVALLPGAGSRPVVAVTVIVGILVWTLFTIQDAALTTLHRTRWLPVENVLAGCAKVGLLFGLSSFACGVVWAALLPAVVAVIILSPLIGRASRERNQHISAGGIPLADVEALRTMRRLAVRTTTSVVLTLGALTFLPFLVTAVSGPAQGALFSLALSIAAVLDYVSAGVGTAFVVHASENLDRSLGLVVFALKRTVAVVAGVAAVIVVLTPELFRVLNPFYLHLHAVAVVTVLAVTSVARTVYLIWSSHQQARQHLGPVLRLNVVAAVLVYGIVLTANSHSGALTAAAALAGAQVVLTAGALCFLVSEHREATRASMNPLLAERSVVDHVPTLPANATVATEPAGQS